MLGYEKLWIIGEKFVEDTFRQCMMPASQETDTIHLYTKTNFQLSHFEGKGAGNFIVRIRNAFVQALHTEVLLPKYVVIVLDADFFADLSISKFGLTQLMERGLNWIAKEVYRLALTQKENLPTKFVKQNYPKFLWAIAPGHKYFVDNDKRRKYNNCIEDACKNFHNMHVLHLKNFWDYDKEGMVMCTGNRAGYRITANGLHNYWRSIDDAIKYWDTKVGPPGQGKSHAKKKLSFGQDWFHWSRNKNSFGG